MRCVSSSNPWGAHHRDCTYRLELPSENLSFDEEVSLTSYRIIQECLTNVARHSKAKAMQIALRYSADAKTPGIHIRIEDNGIGLPAGFRFGFGFLGMSERLRKLGGQLNISNAPRTGTIIEAFIPASPRSSERVFSERLENILIKG